MRRAGSIALGLGLAFRLAAFDSASELARGGSQAAGFGQRWQGNPARLGAAADFEVQAGGRIRGFADGTAGGELTLPGGESGGLGAQLDWMEKGDERLGATLGYGRELLPRLWLGSALQAVKHSDGSGKSSVVRVKLGAQYGLGENLRFGLSTPDLLAIHAGLAVLWRGNEINADYESSVARLGFEAPLPLKFLALRGAGLYDGFAFTASAGLGIFWGAYAIDYAWRNDSGGTGSHAFSLSWRPELKSVTPLGPKPPSLDQPINIEAPLLPELPNEPLKAPDPE